MIAQKLLITTRTWACQVNLDERDLVIFTCPMLRTFQGQHWLKLREWIYNKFSDVEIIKL